MSAMMRCKLKLNEVRIAGTDPQSGAVTAVGVKLGAVYESDEKKRLDPSNENALFGKYTPHGAFEATIYNEHLAPLLVKALGKEFYVDFTPALPAAVTQE